MLSIEQRFIDDTQFTFQKQQNQQKLTNQQNEYDFKFNYQFVNVYRQKNHRVSLLQRNNYQNQRNNYSSQRSMTYQNDAKKSNDDNQRNENVESWQFNENITDEYHDRKKSNERVWNNFFVTNYTKNNYNSKYVNVDFVDASRIQKHECRLCNQIFYFNNKFHKHVRECRKTFTTSFSKTKIVSNDIYIQQIDVWKYFIIKFVVSSNKNDDYDFRNWKYCTIKIIVTHENVMKNLCLNIDCAMSLIDRKWLHVLLSNVVVRQIAEFVMIREIDDREHFSADYVNLDFYIDDKIKNKSIIVHIKRDVHIVDNLKIKILIDFDIICSKEMIVDLQKWKFTIVNCDLTISIICTSTTSRVNRIFRFKQIVIISTHTIMIVSFKFQSD